MKRTDKNIGKGTKKEIPSEKKDLVKEYNKKKMVGETQAGFGIKSGKERTRNRDGGE